MKLKDLINEFAIKAKANIVDLAQTELSNENKKLTLDHKLYEFLEDMIEKVKINFVLKMALKKLLLPNVSQITQIIYDLLKAKVEGITK